MLLNENRFFPIDESSRNIAKRLFQEVEKLPIISPHGHTDPYWFAQNENFTNATDLLVIPDHYILRMLISQGLNLKDLGVVTNNEKSSKKDKREIWRLFANNYYLFRSTPSRLWMNHTFENLFGINKPLNEKNSRLLF